MDFSLNNGTMSDPQEDLRNRILKEKEDINEMIEVAEKEKNDLQKSIEDIKKRKGDLQKSIDHIKKRKVALQKLEAMELESASGAPVREYKLLILGDNGIGKSTFLKRFVTDKDMYVNKGGGHIHSLRFSTNRGHPIKFNVCDTRQLSTCDGNWVESQGAILMFDGSARITYKNVSSMHHDLTRVCRDIPIALVGNKMDLVTCHARVNRLGFDSEVGVPFYKISAANGDYDSVAQPFLWLARQLKGDDELYFIEAP